MPTCREVITAAGRRAGLLDARRNLSGAEGERYLEVLRDLYLGWIGAGLFGRFNDVLLETDTYTMREQDRVLVNDVSSVSIDFPATVTDCDTGQTRPVRDLSIGEVTDVSSTDRATFIYDSAYAAWMQVDALTLDSEAPLCVRFKGAIVANLAVSLADENQQPVSAILSREAGLGKLALAGAMGSPRQITKAEYF